jgi:hypothetical protein
MTRYSITGNNNICYSDGVAPLDIGWEIGFVPRKATNN